MLSKIKAFTLAEVMVTLAIMGVLASIMLPVLKDIQPDKTKAAFKKAYYVTERVVYDMVTDDSIYPSLGAYKGFDNTEAATFQGTSYSGDTKFIRLFAAHVNKISTSSPNGASIPADDTAGSPNIVTSDGICWYIPASNFSGLYGNEDVSHALGIMVDVNGSSNAPNKLGLDRFMIYVQADGRIFVKDGTAAGNKAAAYISSSNIKKE